MFRVMEPKEHRCHKDSIDHLIRLMSFRYRSNLLRDIYPYTPITFLIKEQLGQLLGGGFLLEREGESLPEGIREKLDCLVSYKYRIWHGFFISQLERLSFYKANFFKIFREAFYEDLYQALLKFGKQHHIKILYLTLPAQDYDYIPDMKLLPFIDVVNPQDSWDGHFHGILSLLPQKNLFQKIFEEKWASFNQELAS